MPPMEEADCWDTAVLWEHDGGFDAQGQPTYKDPVQLAWPNGVRWIDKVSWSTDPLGNLVQVDATAVVLQDIPVHSRIWKGTLNDWVRDATLATRDQRVMVVKTSNSTDDTKGRFSRRTVGLMKYHNTGV